MRRVIVIGVVVPSIVAASAVSARAIDQVTRHLTITPAEDTVAMGKCLMLVATVTETRPGEGARRVENVPVDVHAIASNGRAQFAVMTEPRATDPFGPPSLVGAGSSGIRAGDLNHLSEPAAACHLGDRSGNHQTAVQGDDKMIPDRNHVEGMTSSGSSRLGEFAFGVTSLFDGAESALTVEAFLDVDGNNARSEAETSRRITINWNVGIPSGLITSIDPVTAQVGSTATIVSTLKDQNADLMNGRIVRSRVASGPHAGRVLPSCTTGSVAAGSCTISFTGEVAGQDAITSWADRSGPGHTDEVLDADEPSSTISIMWSAPPQPVATALTLATNPGARNEHGLAVYGVSYRLEPVLTTISGAPLAGRTIKIQRRASGVAEFTDLSTATTDAQGRCSVTVQSERTTEYRALFGGDTSNRPALSGIVRAPVHVAMTASVLRRWTPKRQPTYIHGTVAPAHSGTIVWLQMLQADGRTYRWAGTTRLTSCQGGTASCYRLHYTRTTPGFLVFRVVWHTQDRDHGWNTSKRIRADWY